MTWISVIAFHCKCNRHSDISKQNVNITQQLENMPKKNHPVRKYSIEDMDNLISSNLAGTNDREGDLAERIGRNRGYFSQIRSRKHVTPRIINLLEKDLNEKGDRLEKETARSKPDLTVEEIIFLRAAVTHLLSEVASIKSKEQNRPFDDVLDESERNIQSTLRVLLKAKG